MFEDANTTGGGVKQAWRVLPEGIDMLMWVNDWPFTKVYDELEAWLGEKPDHYLVHRKKEKTPRLDEKNLRRWLNKIWQEALPLDHKDAFPARAYFDNRQIKKAALASGDLKFHPEINYTDYQRRFLGKFAAVLSLVRNNRGCPVAIFRTYLSDEGFKLNLGEPNVAKKSTPAIDRYPGRQVRLFAPSEGVLGVAEGLETALAVYQAKQFPVWPMLSSTNLQQFVPPDGVHTVLNFVDKDRSQAGEKSAAILRKKLKAKGTRVVDLLPPAPILEADKGVDWADQLIRDPSGFDLFDQALAELNMNLPVT